MLDTGGGTVVGYGLAQAQLLRLKSAGLKLTVIPSPATQDLTVLQARLDRMVCSLEEVCSFKGWRLAA